MGGGFGESGSWRQESAALSPCSAAAPLAGSTGLRRSPLALEAYAWLTYRVSRLERETVVPWRSLEIQFGAEYKHPRPFRWRFQLDADGIARTPKLLASFPTFTEKDAEKWGAMEDPAAEAAFESLVRAEAAKTSAA